MHLNEIQILNFENMLTPNGQAPGTRFEGNLQHDQAPATAYNQMPNAVSHQDTRTQTTSFSFYLDDASRDFLIEKIFRSQILYITYNLVIYGTTKIWHLPDCLEA